MLQHFQAIGMVLLLVRLLCAQQTARDGVFRVGAGVSSPRILRKSEPSFTRQAIDARIQGTAVFEIVVDQNGDPMDIRVLSPLGFGLDEQAQSNIEKWKFAPGMKDGRPVKVLATVEVNFRMLGQNFDQAAEQRRTRFNMALQKLKSLNGEPDQDLVKTVEQLAREKLPAAMCLLGRWLNSGQGIPKDPARGLELIQKAADKTYGPAMYEIGRRYLDADGFPRDAAKGLKMIREAAVLGSLGAQYYLGSHYESGEVLEHDEARARQFFRLCAARGQAACQYAIGRLLYNAPDRQERQFIQALAWFQLAADQKISQAKAIVDNEMPKLTPEQAGWVRKLQAQLVQR